MFTLSTYLTINILYIPFVQQLGIEQLFFDAHVHFQSFDFLLLLPINNNVIDILQKCLLYICIKGHQSLNLYTYNQKVKKK